MSQAIELYRFVKGSDVWTFTNIDSSYDYNLETYEPAPISRGDTEQNDEVSRANLNVSLSVLNDLGAELVRYRDEHMLSLTVFSVTENWDGSPIVKVEWKGRVTSAVASGAKIDFKCESVFTSLRRPGLRARYQKTCRHTLYSVACGVLKALFGVAGTATALTNVTLTVAEAASQPDGYFKGGMAETADGALRFIMAHVGATLTLAYPMPDLAQAITDDGSAPVTLYPGCDHLKSTCQDKFDNLRRFGGFPWIPDRNPMDGSSIV